MSRFGRHSRSFHARPASSLYFVLLKRCLLSVPARHDGQYFRIALRCCLFLDYIKPSERISFPEAKRPNTRSTPPHSTDVQFRKADRLPLTARKEHLVLPA